MKKQRMTCAICILIGALFLSACAAVPGTGKQSLPQLSIGVVDYPPYSYTDIDGAYAGIDIELAREACARLGYEPVFQKIPVTMRDRSLIEGEVDCLWTCLTIEERQDQYQWAGPYLYTRRVVAVASDSMIRELPDLEQKTIAVQAGSTSEMILSDTKNRMHLPNLKRINVYSDIGTVFTALRKGYVDAIAGHEGSLNSYMAEYPGKFRYLDMSLNRAGLGVAFRKDTDAKMVQSLTDVLNEMTQDGTTAEILSVHGLDAATNLYDGSL